MRISPEIIETIKPELLLAAGNNGKLFKSFDSSTWTTLTSDIIDKKIYFIKNDGSGDNNITFLGVDND
jgi:hypothetical protein